MLSKIDDVVLIQLPKIRDDRGNLSFVENNSQIPFEIKRTYWIYDVPSGESRGGHASLSNDEFVIPLSGGFDVIIDDGIAKKTITLNRPYCGLFIPHGIWREFVNFSTNSVALELGSELYSMDDYVRSYHEFLEMKVNEKI